MQYADGSIIDEGCVDNEYMMARAEGYRGYAAALGPLGGNRDGFWTRTAEYVDAEYATTDTYVVALDNGNRVNVRRDLQCMTGAQVGDRIRIGSSVGDFSTGRREYYNLSRGPPPMRPLKRFLHQVHKGGDGCDYEVCAQGQKGRYVWIKITKS